ncbi:MAG: hypothetical protein US53_C0004G0007 [Candidatus Woesebacteria bacterium GW2011_GWA1_37_7]|uniref:Uncharacterized protein n=1 Tax=Candidatus Woesebacteria bacterium GW2011_GWA1_37_7 TaxID=1618545 RepID=A0A0G0H411_9BACT|nr:MAG: hypothetical protein US53_C0004G0007 [Candidatus Woesebacteria bacterium GW2011_GWA1_37_7]
MDGVQKLLAIVIIVLTVLLSIVGIQVVLIIIDLRRVVKRLNSLLEDSILGGGLIRPDKLTGIFEFLKRKKNVEHHGSVDVDNKRTEIN